MDPIDEEHHVTLTFVDRDGAEHPFLDAYVLAVEVPGLVALAQQRIAAEPDHRGFVLRIGD